MSPFRPSVDAHAEASGSIARHYRTPTAHTTTASRSPPRPAPSIDLATILSRPQLEAAINEADKLDRVDPYSLGASLEERSGQRGVAVLKAILDRRTFVLTRSELERRFLPIARQAGLPKPETQALVNGFEVDFFWPALGLVVETDGLRYHRTPSEQARDRLRDQAHTAVGLTPLRFTHGQVRYEPDHVRRILGAVARRLVVGRAPPVADQLQR
jgi:very-short-patch-repair endonuclease